MMHLRVLAALLLASALGVVSCTPGEDGPSSPSATEPSHLLTSGDAVLGTDVGSGLLACTPLPYAIATRTIGSGGGTIVVGPHSLTVPTGALTAPVTITAEAPVGTVNSVRLLPEGLRFAPGKPARLSLSYANCSLAARLLPKRIAYTNELLQILSYVLSVDDRSTKRVTGSLKHFSRYAVAW
jgi:hypothetical protein